jgi:hypothetical protein
MNRPGQSDFHQQAQKQALEFHTDLVASSAARRLAGRDEEGTPARSRQARTTQGSQTPAVTGGQVVGFRWPVVAGALQAGGRPDSGRRGPCQRGECVVPIATSKAVNGGAATAPPHQNNMALG